MGEMERHEAGELVAEINEAHRACEVAVRSAVGHAIRAGELLIEAKSHVPHGAWGPWLAENFEGSERTAQAYMKLARDRHQLNPQRVADLSIRGALRELAVPESEGGAGDDWTSRLVGLPLERRRGFEREAVIVAFVDAHTRLLQLLNEARARLVAHLEVLEAAKPGSYLREMIERIGDKGADVPLDNEEQAFVRRIWPDLLRKIEEAGRDEREADVTIARLEKSVRPVDMPPGRERFSLEKRLSAEEMRTPLQALIASGVLEQQGPACVGR